MQSRLTLGCLLAVLVSGNLAQAAVEPVSSLLERVRIGEATGREDLVSNALYSLSLVDPEHPELLAAKARQALRSGKIKEAEALLARLGTLAPDSRLYHLGMANLAVNNGAQRQQLQQARLLVNAGRLEEGAKLYRSLFVDGVAPNLEMAIEYASLQLRLPGQRAKGMAGLEALNRAYPGQPRIRAALARNYLADDRWQEARVLLEQMARSEYDRGEAAEIWLANIKELPVGPGSLAELQRYIAAFGTGTEAKQGMALLAEQEAKWASPAYRARQQALASNEGGKASIAELQRALAANPDDPELMGALGQAYSRNNQRALAIAQFERLLRHPDVTNKDKWSSLLATNRYWLLIDQAEQASKRQQGEEARALYRQAIKQDGREPEAWLGLGDAELALHREAEAETAYRKALGLGARDRALARLFELYKEKDPEQALALLAQSRDPAWQQEAGRLRSELLQSQADTLDQAGKLEQALAQREQALTLTPDDVWLAYRVAVTRARLGDASGGEQLLRDKLAARPQEMSLRYATALYLSGQDKNTEARVLLAAVPTRTWSADMRELDGRLARGEVLAQARALHERGDERGAEGLLRPLLPDEEVSLILAEWAAARGDWNAAEGHYREVLARSPQQDEARLGMAELMLARGDEAQALGWLPVWPVSPLPADEFNFYRRVANLYQALGQEEKAQAIFATYEPLVRGQPASEQTALFWRDAARQRFDASDANGAIERDRKGLVAAGLAPREDLDEAALTRLARSRDGEGWLASGLRSDLDRHYRQSQTTVSLDSDYWGSSGTGGLSDLRALTQMLQLDTPLAGGTFFGRLELVDMDAGKLPASPYREEFGTCAARDCYGQEHQHNTGTTLAAGWHGGAWAFDLGTTPLGFEVVDWVGGATVEGDLGDLGWGLTLSRRPVSSSLLSYSGTVDPGTGIRWGGVRANGVRIDLSHDLGGAIGFWGSAQQHLLTGKNVPDNWRTRLMGGTYYKLVNETNRRVSVGLSSMLWHYQKDLSGYTFGQGGYYSPQGYFSLSVPVNYRQRTADWSWELGGSGSWSHSRTDDSRRYPLEGLLPAGLPDRDAPVKGGSSSGFGYTLNAIVEHRLTDHWRIGGRVDIQQADDYAPSHATLFLRYTFKPWQGDLDMPPQPLTPYADFD